MYHLKSLLTLNYSRKRKHILLDLIYPAAKSKILTKIYKSKYFFSFKLSEVNMPYILS